MANFYATYSPSSPTGPVVVTANQGTTPWVVTGSGTAGAAAPGVVTVQGIAGGTTVPVSGTVTASNPSVAATGGAVPASATLAGMDVAGILTALTGTANGLKVDQGVSPWIVGGTVTANQGTSPWVTSVSNFPATVAVTQSTSPWIVNGSGFTQPVSGTVAVSSVAGSVAVTGTFFQATQPVSGTVAVSNFPATQPVSGTVAVTQSTSPWVVDGSGVTQPISAASLPLPTGASTSALQTTGNTSLASIDGKLNSLGQKAMAASVPVVIASDQSAVPVSGTVAVSNFPATQPVSGTVAVSSVGGTVAVTQSTSPWVVSGTVTANAGTGTMTTDQVATTSATFQDGAIAFGSLTTSFATVITTGGALRIVQVRNNTNAVVAVSFNAGSTTSYTLDAGDFLSLDLKMNGINIPTSTALQAKYVGSAPTSGSIRINGVY